MKFLKAALCMIFFVNLAFCEDGIKDLAQKCEAGEVKECVKAGNYLHLIAADDEGSLKYFEMACVKKDAPSCTEGANVAIFIQNNAKAFELFTKGCELNDASSCHGLAQCYKDGLGTAKDEAAALSYYKKACEGGKKSACTAMNTKRR